MLRLSTKQHLSVRLHGIPAATLTRLDSGALELAYLPEWLSSAKAFQLSVSLPLREEPYLDERVTPFFAGLLPDSRQHRKKIAETFHASETNDFSLLAAIGRDCAGAVSVVPMNALVIPEDEIPESFEPLDERNLAHFIRDLPRRPLLLDDEIRLSLAGMHDKAAVLIKNKTIGLPHGGYPSSHILKTDITGLPDSIRTEFFTLKLADATGIKTPACAVLTAEDQHFMLIARYDRVSFRPSGAKDTSMRIRRVHQEDFCQAMSVSPDLKYEREGGPGWIDAFGLLDSLDEPGAARIDLLNRAILQFLIDNPDAHAKNYSLLHGQRGTRLAPIYDLNNAAVHRQHFKRAESRLAMSIAGEFDPRHITGSHWDRFSAQNGLSAPLVRQVILQMAQRLPDHASTLCEGLRGTPAWSDKLPAIVDDIAHRCTLVPEMLSKTADLSPMIDISRRVSFSGMEP